MQIHEELKQNKLIIFVSGDVIQPAFCLELPTAWHEEILWKVNVLKMSNL